MENYSYKHQLSLYIMQISTICDKIEPGGYMRLRNVKNKDIIMNNSTYLVKNYYELIIIIQYTLRLVWEKVNLL